MEHLKLSDGEWKLMKVLWNCQPQTSAQRIKIFWRNRSAFLALNARRKPYGTQKE